MVGHVLGLGDRHGENILFDAISGDTVHVDLNCLFEKGQTFEIPERVPFRLTQNMVDALGVTGVDGVFRRAAEVSMAILRDNKDSLMSVLEAMIHDPLVEWTSSHRRKNQTGVDPRLAEARAALTTVRHKLEGFKRRQASSEIQLTTPNLVDSLIRDATSPTNLALMCMLETLNFCVLLFMMIVRTASYLIHDALPLFFFSADIGWASYL